MTNIYFSKNITFASKLLLFTILISIYYLWLSQDFNFNIGPQNIFIHSEL